MEANDDIDEDIHRLQIVLQDEENEEESDAEGELQSLHQDAEDEHRSYMSRSRPSTRSDTASSYPATSVGLEGEDRYQFLDPNNATPESCLAMNRAYQEVLLDLLRQTEMSLNENRQKQKQIEDDIDNLSSGSRQGSRSLGKHFASVTVPYFKDKDGRCPPDNEDVQQKKQLQEGKQHVRPSATWSKFARKKLINAVAMDTLEKLIRPIMSRLEIESSKLRNCKNQEEIDDCKERIETLQKEIETKRRIPESELIKNVDADKVDWLKLSVIGFKTKIDATDCERTWRNVLRPEINRDKWTEIEEEQLQVLVEKYNMRNWTQIAKELGTSRTPFQCLQHYQQHSQVYDKSPWTQEEDELLKEVVETCKFGKDAVHFHQVAYYIEGRSAQMCSKRWEEINPEKKKGRWSGHEDCLLVAAVQALGNNNWLKVSDLVPSRTSAQCRERWNNVLNPELRPKSWTYEEDKELLRLIQVYGIGYQDIHKSMNEFEFRSDPMLAAFKYLKTTLSPGNWASMTQELPGRTDNSLLQRYRRLMIWKQQCETFFAMPENMQKRMIMGINTVQRKGKREKKRWYSRYNEDLSKLNWYKKKDYKHYSDVGALAKDVGLLNEDYIKILEDQQKNELVVPRALPISRFMRGCTVNKWKKKSGLNDLVQAEIRKTRKGNPNSSTTSLRPRFGSSRRPLDKEPDDQWKEVAVAMSEQDPGQMTVKELLRISRYIKKYGRAPPEDDFTDEEEEVGEINEEFNTDDEDIVQPAFTEERKRTSRPLPQEHIVKLIEGRYKSKEMSKKVQDAILEQYKKKYAKKTLRRPKKYRLFPQHVFENQSLKDEQEKLRKKSLILMLKSMDVDSIRAFKKARKHFKEQSLILKAKEENEKAREKRTHERRRTRVKFSIPEPADPKPEIKDSAKVMIELKKELNIQDDDDDNEEDIDFNRAKLSREALIPKIEEIKRDGGEKEDSSQVNDNGVKTSESGSSDVGRTSADEEGRAKKNETQSETQGEGCSSSSSGHVDKNSNEGSVIRVIEDNASGSIANVSSSTTGSSANVNSSAADSSANINGSATGSSANINSSATGSSANVNSSAPGSSANANRSAGGSSANVNSSATGSSANINSSATGSSANVNSSATAGKSNSVAATAATELLSPAVTALPTQPYGKKLPFIPPNYTNLKALRSLLDDREKLFAKACQQFKVAELRNEFYEKPKSNATPYMRSLLSLVNPDKGEIRKRAKRKLDNDLEKNSFVDSIEKVKKSYEFTKLKARFLAMFTWPALISTVKPPKDNKLLQTEASASAQNESHKDSEKENMDGDGDSPVQTPCIDASDESSDDSGSEMEIAPEVSTTSARKRTMQQLEPEDNQDRDDTTPTKKCRKMKMIPLEYKDLEKMVETELTEKEEMEIMVMNIMCRTHGDKKKALAASFFGRERRKILRRLGLHEKMKRLEKQEETGEIRKPVKQRKKKERRFVNLDENSSHRPQTRGSSRMNQQVPLDVTAPVKMEAQLVSEEMLAASPTHEAPVSDQEPGNPVIDINYTINEEEKGSAKVVIKLNLIENDNSFTSTNDNAESGLMEQSVIEQPQGQQVTVQEPITDSVASSAVGTAVKGSPVLGEQHTQQVTSQESRTGPVVSSTLGVAVQESAVSVIESQASPSSQESTIETPSSNSMKTDIQGSAVSIVESQASSSSQESTMETPSSNSVKTVIQGSSPAVLESIRSSMNSVVKSNETVMSLAGGTAQESTASVKESKPSSSSAGIATQETLASVKESQHSATSLPVAQTLQVVSPPSSASGSGFPSGVLTLPVLPPSDSPEPRAPSSLPPSSLPPSSLPPSSLPPAISKENSSEENSPTFDGTSVPSNVGLSSSVSNENTKFVPLTLPVLPPTGSFMTSSPAAIPESTTTSAGLVSSGLTKAGTSSSVSTDNTKPVPLTLSVLPPAGFPKAGSFTTSPAGVSGSTTTLAGLVSSGLANMGELSSKSSENTGPFPKLQAQNNTLTDPTATRSVTIQAVVGNSIVPMVLQIVDPDMIVMDGKSSNENNESKSRSCETSQNVSEKIGTLDLDRTQVIENMNETGSSSIGTTQTANGVSETNGSSCTDRAETASADSNASAMMEKDGTNNGIDSKDVGDTQKVVGSKTIDKTGDNANVHKENSSSHDSNTNTNFKDS